MAEVETRVIKRVIKNKPSRYKKKEQNKYPKLLITISLSLFTVDTLYRLIFNINYDNRFECILAKVFPRNVFIFYENFIELWLVMIFGIFAAVILKKYFSKYKKFYPRGPFTAFLYGSIMPVCACSTIPMLTTLKGKMRFKTIVTFIMAAPMLSPIIITLSFSILGFKYAILRIICSFMLAIGAGYVLDFFRRDELEDIELGAALACNKDDCLITEKGVFDETWAITKKLLPYILFAGTISCIFAFFETQLIEYLRELIWSWHGKFLAILIGIPLYVCNGADVFFLRPLVTHDIGLPYGPAIAFSLSASVICIPSIIILAKILGKRLTGILISYVAVACLLFGFIF